LSTISVGSSFVTANPKSVRGLNRAWGALHALLQDEMEETAATRAAAPCGLSTPEILARILPPKDNIGARGSESQPREKRVRPWRIASKRFTISDNHVAEGSIT
jgi:hypothetical protein